MKPFKIMCLDSSHGWQPLFNTVFHFYNPHGIQSRDATYRMLSLLLSCRKMRRIWNLFSQLHWICLTCRGIKIGSLQWTRGRLGFIIFVCNLMTETEATSGTFCVLTKNETMKEVIYHSRNVQLSEAFRLFTIYSVWKQVAQENMQVTRTRYCAAISVIRYVCSCRGGDRELVQFCWGILVMSCYFGPMKWEHNIRMGLTEIDFEGGRWWL